MYNNLALFFRIRWKSKNREVSYKFNSRILVNNMRPLLGCSNLNLKLEKQN